MCGFRHACKRASEFSVKRLCVYLAFGLQLGQVERDNEEYILANKFSTEVCVALSKLASPYQQMIKLISKYTAFVFFTT